MNRRIYELPKKVVDYALRRFNTGLTWTQADDEESLLPASAPYCPALPINSKRLPANLEAVFHEETTLPAVRLFKIRRANVSWHAVVFRNLRVFFGSLAHPRELRSYSDMYLLKQWFGETIRLTADTSEVVLVHDQWTAGNYYHWIVDSLSRLILVQRAHPDCQLIMPAPVPAFIRESVEMMGFNKLILLQKNQTLLSVDLLVPEHVTPPGFQRPEILQQIRAQLLQAVYEDSTPPNAYRRVYISRRLQRVRRLLNEDAIEYLLEQHGYEIIEFEKISFVEQIKIMSETERFISIHGAGLTNILFLPPEARVAELMNENKVSANQGKDFENLIYFRMANVLGLPYYCLPCASTGEDALTNEAHLHVDSIAFAQLLQDLDN